MILACITRTVVAGHLQLLHKVLEGPCIARTDRAVIDEGAVGALVHLGARVILYPVYKGVVDIFFLFVVAFEASCPCQYLLRIRIKLGLGSLQVVCCPVKTQVYLGALSMRVVQALIGGIQPEKLRMISYDRGENVLKALSAQVALHRAETAV